MKINDETDADYMVRMLRDNFNAALEMEKRAALKARGRIRRP
jgi:hypothetical protein